MSERYLITSALPYVNNRPHLGHLVGCILPADVYARFLRLKGKEAIYICGTDEHGTASEIAARDAGMSVQEWCDKLHEEHRKDYEWFNIEFTKFGRTSSKTNHEMTQHLFLRLYENGYITEGETEQLYCEHCQMFLPDRYVIGKCPYCGAETHAGQCESCGRLIEPTELLEPRCAFCGSTPVVRKTKHLYLDLPKFKEKLSSWIESNKHWKPNVRNWALSLIPDLRPRPITRDLKWGVNVPIPGYEDKVFYVWFDAPIGYISITKEWADEVGDSWERWWKDKDTKLIHFIGKDNIPFHTIIFPATLMGADEGFVLPYDVPAMEFLNYEGKKFSKSKGVGVFLKDVRDMPYPPDYWRLALMWVAPETGDTDFTWEVFAKAVNELADTYGNLVNRVLVLTRKYFNQVVPEPGEFNEDDKKFVEFLKSSPDQVGNELEISRFREALKRAMDVAREANAYLNAQEPWKKENEARRATVIYLSLNAVKTASILLNPFIPEITSKSLSLLGLDATSLSWDSAGEFDLLPGTKVGAPQILVKKIDQKELDKWKSKFDRNKNKNPEEDELGGVKMVDQITYDEFAKLDIRIAKVLKAEEVEGSKKLIRLELDVGELGKRQILAGLKQWYSPSDLEGKHIVILANLKPKKMMGMESQGMLLAAENNDDVVLLVPERPIAPGAKVH